ncbi:MAG: TonB-dependent receptor [Pseudomonadota bacterium]
MFWKRGQHAAWLIAAAASGALVSHDLAAQFVDEIVVVARKRAENIQEIPVAVTAVTTDEILERNLRDLSDISKLTPGLLFDQEFGRTSNRPVIRGGANILGDSGVAYFIDGVYFQGSIADFNLNEVERIEVVKGPQSALYGRNTYSGAINIITRSPSEGFSADVTISATDDNETQLAATIGGPIWGDVLSGSLSVRQFELDGAWTNEFDGSDIGLQESTSVSGVLEFRPTDRLTARFRAYYNDLNDGQPPLFAQDSTQNNCFEDNGSFYNGLGRYYCGTLRPGSINTDFSVGAPNAREEQQTLQTSLRIDYDFSDAWTLTSITGFIDRDTVQITDGDYSPTSFQVANFTPNGFPFGGFADGPPFDYAYVGQIVDFTFAGWDQNEDFSQELRLTYSSDKLNAFIGGYYFDSETEGRDVRDLPAAAAGIAGANFGAEFGRMQGVCAANFLCGSIVPFFGPTIGVTRNMDNEKIENTALFGHVDVALSDTVSLTIEGRYQEEDITDTVVLRNLGGPIDSTTTVDGSFNSYLQRYSLDWKPTDTTLIYAAVATGTKPGGSNGSAGLQAGEPTFDEEDLTSIEIGAKNTFFDNQLIANIALYSNTVTGYQLTQNAETEFGTVSIIRNVGDARINGAEFEFRARPADFDGLTLTANYAYTDAKFRRGTDQNQGVLNDVADDGLVNCSLGAEFGSVADCEDSAFGSIAGNRVPRTAQHQFYIDAELRRQLNNSWEWYAGVDYTFESSKFAQVHNLIETGDAGLLGARFGLSNGRYSIMAYGRNLANENSSPLVLRYADASGSFRRSFVGYARREAHWGVNFTARFGE